MKRSSVLFYFLVLCVAIGAQQHRGLVLRRGQRFDIGHDIQRRDIVGDRRWRGAGGMAGQVKSG